MDINYSYCRLCAESKPCNKQVDLQSDHEKKIEIIEKLIRVNAATDFEGSLPTTVCFDCIITLNKAFHFVITIEGAHNALCEIFSLETVKKEKLELEDNHRQQASDSDEETKLAIKEEFDEEDNDKELGDFNRDSYSDCDIPPRLAKVKKSKRKDNDLDIDSIPLSQLSQLKLTWSSYSWFCTYCETQFSNIDELNAHSMKCHNVCNPYRCTDCKTRKMKLDSFLIHVQRHHKHLRYSCYKCLKQFETTAAARRHKMTHLTSKFICSGCNIPFPNNEELKRHMEAYNQLTRGKPIPKVLQTDGLTCKVCQKSFKTRSGLNTHVLIHTERKKDNMCEVCGKGFFLKYNLEAHMVMHKDDRPHKCQICSYAFKTARLLKNHVGVHVNDKPYSCSQCGRCFRLRKQLESHSIIHTDIHPYVCTHCNKRFRFKSILNNHVRLHTGIRPYSCETCQRDFTNWSNYNKHMKRKHNMDTSKKKHTPDGVYPIDPKTGAVIIREETNQIIEWKKKMLVHRRIGRPAKEIDKTISIESNKLTVDNV